MKNKTKNGYRASHNAKEYKTSYRVTVLNKS